MPSVTNWTVEPGRGQPSGTWWVTTKAGTSHGCWPPQPSATSNVRRPVRKAPTSAIKPFTCSALSGETWNVMSDVVLGMETSTSPEKYQSNTSSTPSFASATYPSRDIDMSATTLLMVQLLSHQGLGSEQCRGHDDDRHTHAGKRSRRAEHETANVPGRVKEGDSVFLPGVLQPPGRPAAPSSSR